MKDEHKRADPDVESLLSGYSLLDALRFRRSRRFGVGMKMETGPLRYASELPLEPLSEAELAALAFAACGVTGYALGDLVYESGQGGTMMGSFLGRTVGSGDAVQSVAVVIANDEATWLLKRPQDFVPGEYPEIVELARRGELTELFRRSRIKLADRRLAPQLDVPKNLDVNQWDLYRPGTAYIVPINEYTYMYINALLELLNETMAMFLVDERKRFRPAGLSKFANSRGGHLVDDPAAQRTLSVERVESMLQAVVMVEQGMMLQNLGLIAQAMGIGGFPNFAGHEFAWFEALGFRMQTASTLEYLGAGRAVRTLAGWRGKNPRLAYPIGLERGDDVLLQPYCPPYYPTMEAAVRAVVDRKFGANGHFRGGVDQSGWRDPHAIAKEAPPLTTAAIDAAIAYTTYLYETYGRFPVYPAPFRTVLGFQAAHLDVAFYDRFYRAEALSDTHRQHATRWHPA